MALQNIVKFSFFLVLTLIFGSLIYSPDFASDDFKKEVSQVVLKDISDSSGFNLHHSYNLNYALHVVPEVVHLKEWYESVSASVSIVDINEDGYYDAFLNSGALGHKSKLFINNKDGTFSNRAHEYGINDFGGGTNRIVFFDCDNDKKMEMLVIGSLETKVFKKNTNNRFEFFQHVFRYKGYYSASAVNIFDYNHDGHLDIVFNSSVGSESPNSMVSASNAKDDVKLYKGVGGCKFQNAKSDFDQEGNLFVHAIGVGDFWNKDKNDLWFATDFNKDHIYKQENDYKYKNVSQLKESYQSQNGMSAEIFYEPNSPFPYIFVSHIFEPGYHIQGNMLWKWNKEKKRFENYAKKKNLDKCGWAWGAASVDLENDGDLDLVVGNGFISSNSKNNFWFKMSTTLSSSKEIVGNPRNWPSMKGVNLSGNQQACLYLNKGNGTFEDVSKDLGFDFDKRNNRGVARFDFNNDGLIDFVISNQKEKAYLYKNSSKGYNNWLGFKLEATRSHWQALSAKMILTLKDGTKLYRKNFNLNGYASQHDPRIVFGLGKKEPAMLEVIWPSGHKTSYDNLELNKYHHIIEDSDS